MGQISLGLAVGLVLVLWPRPEMPATMTHVPFLKFRYLDFGWLFVPFVIFVITASSNSVNLTDGLDGLASGLVAIAALTFAGMCYLCGHAKFSGYLNLTYLPYGGELTVFCSAVLGASLGFLWYNCHPADVFMGDTGSLSLGGALGVVSVLIKREFWLVLVGGLFVADAVGHDPGRIVPPVQAARVPDVAAPSPFRVERLGGGAGRAPVLHRRRAARAAFALDPQAAMTIDARHPLPGNRALVAGAARSGLAAAALLRRHDLDVVVCDAAPATERAEAVRRLATLGVTARFGRDDAGLLDDRDLTIWSPGLAFDHPLAVAARARVCL